VFGTPHTPASFYALPAFAALGAAVLLAGLLTAGRWPPDRARLVRRVAGGLATVVPAGYELLDTSGDGIAGAARVLLVGPLAALGAALWAAWAWRDRRRAAPG
jgi:hypothetical protein